MDAQIIIPSNQMKINDIGKNLFDCGSSVDKKAGNHVNMLKSYRQVFKIMSLRVQTSVAADQTLNF